MVWCSPASFQWTTESARCGNTAADGRQRTEVSLTRLVALARQADLALLPRHFKVSAQRPKCHETAPQV